MPQPALMGTAAQSPCGGPGHGPQALPAGLLADTGVPAVCCAVLEAKAQWS